MARIRKIEIQNFRGVKELVWLPSAGINCLIGPGDSGKSSILDAIDYCVGSRRNIQFTDADFHGLDVEQPIRILVTIGELDDALKNMDVYGLYVRGFDARSGEIEDEPEKEAETVLTVRLTVAGDLEPVWSLVSGRADAQGQVRTLNWGDRVRIAPTRIGVMADYHLSWGRGSVLNRISEERADASAALAKAARDARAAFGDEAQDQLGETLKIVAATAKELGIPVGGSIRAMLDAHAVSFTGGTISLHDEGGVPLRGLGVGSTRLLIVGLQRKAASESSILLMDETEHGLEPHRIIRLLGSLGAKESRLPPLQVFMTTHSPVVLRELAGKQLFVVRRGDQSHEIIQVGTANGIQSTIRLYPDAFLAPSVLVCEGASEVGLMRGLDQFRTSEGEESISASGVALVDCGGGDADSLPTSVLGDPMQAIFGFGQDELAYWDETVCKHFPLGGELATPWRWINAGTEALGEWLLDVRKKLLRGEPVDLRNAPPEVTWVELDGTEDRKRQLTAARVNAPGRDGSVLIIGDSKSPDSQRQFASQTPGAVTVEAVDLRDLVKFARRFDVAAPDSLQQLAQFAQSVMTNVGAADLAQRIEALNRGRARQAGTDLEKAALRFLAAPSHAGAVELLVEIGKEAGVRTHRPAVLRACIKALQLCQGTEGLTFEDAAIRMREQNRLIGRPLPKRAVGSTLLLKGLEAEVAVVLDAGTLDARNLYVAITRGSKKLIVCSESPVLNVD